ncbi:MAG TPA: hypothetical protein VKJ07_00880, partial [Mycobacteriales bacterium]|nr:hypothetical protein [Mycobacteriales bacterium]
GTASCYAAAVTVTDATGDFIAPFVPDATFSVVPATTTLASNASAATFHSVTLSGLVNLNGAAGSATGVTVNASLSKAGGAGACSTTVKADQSWTCDAPVSCAAPATSPCIVDGTYAATAALTEATGAKPVAGAGNAIVDTQPIFAALATTNTQRPTFRGSINGALNPNRVLVCNAAATACAADGTGVNRPLCGNTGDVVSVAPGTGTWSCAPGPGVGAAIPPAAYSIVAYERDVRNNLSAPTSAQGLLVNQTRASLDTFPANLVFNLATSTLVGGGTCAPAEQIKATFSAPLASATCTTTCAGTGTNGSWSCAVPIPVVDRTPGIQIAVSQTAADSTATIPVTKGGFIVDTVAPAAPAISASANAGATRERSPLLQISTSETAGSVDVSVLDASGQTAARCALATVPATPAFTCTPTP